MNYKKQLKTKNFYLRDIFQNIKLGWKPIDIAFLFDTKPQNIQYYINILKDQGIIKKVGYGTWEVKKELKSFSLGFRPTTNLHSFNINIPILKGKVRDNDWIVSKKLRNWIPKYKKVDNLGGLTLKNNNNRSITIFIKSRDIKDIDEVDNLAFQVRAFCHEYFRKEGVILDVMNCKTSNLNVATQDKDIKHTLRKGEKFELDLNKKSEKIFRKDDMDAKAWLDNSPKPASAETNDKEWKREYLSMPFRIRDMFALIHSQLQLLDIQTKSTTALAQNIESHIPSWMSNRKVELELKKIRKVMAEKQKKLGDFI